MRFFVFLSSLGVCICVKCFLDVVLVTKDMTFPCDYDVAKNQISNRKYLLDLFKGRSQLHGQNMLRKHVLNFDQR